jgi:hypothetical protein
MNRIVIAALPVLLTACFLPAPSSSHDTDGLDARHAPEILIAEADCVPDKEGDYWDFDAYVMDLDGAEDVVFVGLDAVDRIGLVGQFRFERVEGDRELWTTQVRGGDTELACDAEYDFI